MKKNSKNIIVIVLIITLVIIIGILAKQVIDSNSSKNVNNDTKKIDNNLNETTQKDEDGNKDNKNYEIFHKLDFSDCTFDDKTCTKEYNDISVTIKMNNYPRPGGDLIINNVEVLSDKYGINALSKIYIIDNNVVVTDYGTDIRTTHLYIYNSKGELLNDIYSLDSKYPSMVIYEFEVIDNKILLKGTRLTHGPVLVKDVNNINWDDEVCNGSYDNEVVQGTYEIEYKEDNNFSEIKNINYDILKDTNYCK